MPAVIEEGYRQGEGIVVCVVGVGRVPLNIHVSCARRSFVDIIDSVNIGWHVMCS